MKVIDIFYFDNEVGDYDEYNPRFVMEEPLVKNIITLMSKKKAYFYTRESLSKKLNASSIKHQISLLNNISAIKEKDGRFCLNFPCFSNKDIRIIRRIVNKSLTKNLINYQNCFKEMELVVKDIYPDIDTKLTLYHLVCGKFFDGVVFDFLESQNVLKQSFEQKDERDYMIIGYQNSFQCRKFNSNLFCSFNHARNNGSSLSSFGNAEGFRCDYFRYFQLRKINKIYGKFKAMHQNLKDYANDEIVSSSLSVIKNLRNNEGSEKNVFFKMLQYTKYLDKEGKIVVPIFSNSDKTVEMIKDYIIKSIGKVILDSFKEITLQVYNKNITAIDHQVDRDQINNEIWHIYFGLLNKRLIKKRIVAKPQRFLGEGRYLKCIYLSEDNSSI